MGLRVSGLSIGLLSAGHALGGAAGAWVGGAVFDASGDYWALWILSVVLAVAAATLVAVLTDSEREPAAARPLARSGPDPGLTSRPGR